jgi:hypothetical protein
MRGIGVFGAVLVGVAVVVLGGVPVIGGQSSEVQIYVPAPVPEVEIPRRPTLGRCLHGSGETQTERNRRNEALALVVSISKAQGQFAETNNRYAQLSELSGLGGPPFGFVLQHAATANSYIFSVKDEKDPCTYTLYSEGMSR